MSAPTLLKEMDIINCVSDYLENNGYRIATRVQSTRDYGPDIVAVSLKDKVRLVVEAKGQTSSALLKSCQYIGKGELAAIALPDDKEDRGLIDSVRSALSRLGIVVFLVDQTRAVRIVGKLPS